MDIGAFLRGVDKGFNDWVDKTDFIPGVSNKGGVRTTDNGANWGKTKTANAVVSPYFDPSKYAVPAELPTETTDVYSGSWDGSGAGGGAGGGGSFAAAVDPDAAIRTQLRNEIAAKGGDIEAAFNSLFGDLDTLVRTRDSELESQYGDQQKKAADQYAGAIPQIETSYAAIGAADSTDNSDAKTGAKKGHDETQATIGKNKQADKAKLGQYHNEQRAKITADKESTSRNVARAGETEDVDALRSMRNDIESGISNANVTRASLGTDSGARGQISALTQDAGRFQAATNALDSIIKSSMSGSVKEAAVKAITDNAGLSDEDKQKVQQQYGNVYAEQAAL